MQIEEIHLVGEGAAVEDALFRNRHVVAQGIGIDAAGAHAAAGALAANDEAVDTFLG